MTREEASKVLEMFLYKQCDLERTKFAYDDNTVWDAVKMASEALKQESVLEKIREDILEYILPYADNTYVIANNHAIERAIMIIDKYRAESEGKE